MACQYPEMEEQLDETPICGPLPFKWDECAFLADIDKNTISSETTDGLIYCNQQDEKIDKLFGNSDTLDYDKAEILVNQIQLWYAGGWFNVVNKDRKDNSLVKYQIKSVEIIIWVICYLRKFIKEKDTVGCIPVFLNNYFWGVKKQLPIKKTKDRYDMIRHDYGADVLDNSFVIFNAWSINQPFKKKTSLFNLINLVKNITNNTNYLSLRNQQIIKSQMDIFRKFIDECHNDVLKMDTPNSKLNAWLQGTLINGIPNKHGKTRK